MMCVFQLLDMRNGNRTVPMACERSAFADSLKTIPDDERQYATVIVIGLEENGEWLFCSNPLLTANRFIEEFSNGREEVYSTT